MAAKTTGSCVSRFIFMLNIALLLRGNFAGDFGYSGAKGPEKWGTMSRDWRACSAGKQQSPVDIARNSLMVRNRLKPLERDYKSANATLVNFGFNIAVKFEEKVGALVLDGKSFTLKQLHWHTPAEHLIDGIRHPAELHLVHRADDDGSIAVVAVLFDFGTQNKFVKKMENGLRKLAKQIRKGNEKSEISIGNVDTKTLITKPSDRFYKYMGSFTTPPCWENITWLIVGKVEEISKKQVEFLKAPLDKAYYHNSRPVQPLNGRSIELYNPSSSHF